MSSSFFTKDQSKIISALYPRNAEQYISLLESFGDFVKDRVLPTSSSTDKNASYPAESIQSVFKQGFTNIPYPEALGGLGLPYPIYIACMEMVAKACASTAISLAIHGTVCDGLHQFGNEDQHEKYLKPLILGEKLGAFALTESGAGSDARSMSTIAELEGDQYRVNGSKMFITNSGKADYYFLFARSGSEKKKNGHIALLLPKEARGFSHGENIAKLGLRGSSLMGLDFKDVLIPKENLIGKEGEGFEYAKRMLFSGRISVAAISVGIAEIALDKSVAYAKERKAFGSTLSEFQMTKEKIARMRTEINAARHLTYFAALLKDEKKDYESEACQAKLFASEMALDVCNEAIQIHGGYGYTDEADVHRHWRDAKLMTIGEGTSEIMEIIISNLALSS